MQFHAGVGRPRQTPAAKNSDFHSEIPAVFLRHQVCRRFRSAKQRMHGAVNPVAGSFSERVPLLILSGGPGEEERKLGTLIHHQAREIESQHRIYQEVTCASGVLTDPRRAAMQLHDVVRAIEEFAANPRPGEVYNLGGGRENSISMLEAIERIEQMCGKKLDWRYVEEARKGDHICYISNLGKFKKDYPNWKITRGLDTILDEIIASQREQMN